MRTAVVAPLRVDTVVRLERHVPTVVPVDLQNGRGHPRRPRCGRGWSTRRRARARGSQIQSAAHTAAWPVRNLSDSGGPVIALQWTKDDLEQLSLVRLDISPSAAMATVGIETRV